MLVNFEQIDAGDRYKLMSGSVVPRPIAWICTEDGTVVNLASFTNK